MGRLSTHVLDTASGVPAAGMRIDLQRGAAADAVTLKSLVANTDGRVDGPLLEGSELSPGTYQLVFHVGAYFRGRGHPDAGKFLDLVPVVFIVSEGEGKYHVPLLVSPWSYATYKGS